MPATEQKDKIIYVSAANNAIQFQDLYLKVRSQEQRIFSDEIVKQLPYVTGNISAHFKEWKVRAHSFERLKKYFDLKNQSLTIMDLGCGNGWAAAGLAKNNLLNVAAVDLNLEELKQGARIFKSSNLSFYFGNIFENIFSSATFDVIVLNACAQYFENLPALIERLFYFLKKDGEIHIVDTPFYTNENMESAKQRTKNYYNSIGFSEMSAFYYHHDIKKMEPFNFEILANTNFFQRVFGFVGGAPGGFKWIRIKKK